MVRTRFRSAVALAALASFVGVLLTLGAALPTEAAPAKGVAYGTIKFPQKDSPKLKVLWFTKDWNYVGAASANGGTYYLKSLDAGTYWLQFVDQRETYHTEKYAPTDIKVTVHSGGSTKKNVTMTKGAFITGTVKTSGKPGKKAEVTAANQSEQSFTTTANNKGQFAIGGLPEGKYSLFSYDHKKAWVDKSTYAGKLKPGKSTNVAINLKKKAGSLRVALFTSANGTTKAVSGNPTVTAVSKQTGQFWSKQVKGGSANFQGLYPGKYKLVANGFGVWFGKTGAIEGAKVKSGQPGFGKFTYTKRGGWLRGSVVDSTDPNRSLSGAVVQLWSASGTKLDETTSSASGSFTLDGLLATQSGLSIVVQPGPYSPYLGTEPDVCAYQSTTSTGFAVKTGQQTDAGKVGIDHVPGQTRPGCA